MYASLLGNLCQNLEVKNDDFFRGIDKAVGYDSLNQLEDAIGVGGTNLE